ncbi:MAG: class I SAM-dependent methyltransferase [Anaerolineales bacterium]
MAHPDANRWNERYSTEVDFWTELQPSQLLKKYSHLLPIRGVALDAACGMGRNGLYLAKRGLRVISLDISETALSRLVQRFEKEGFEPAAAIYDLSNPWFPDEYFDIIINFRFLDRNTFPVYRSSLKPGGILFFETFLKQNNDAHPSANYLESGELLDEFQQFQVILWDEKLITKVGEQTQKWIAQLVARKPD